MKQILQSVFLVVLCTAGALAYEELGGVFDGSPDDASIGYSGPADDAIARLNRKLEDGSVQLRYDARQGSYLRSVLDELRVPVESQIVAMARTSVQQYIIHPGNPRTLYFNDSVIVGYVRGGFIEAAAQDPKQGIIFYTLMAGEKKFERENSCLGCHLSYDTMGVPGTLLRSVFPQPDGYVLPGTGRYATDHRSPLEQRYGGWYVTGKTGPARDLGNLFFTDPDKAKAPAKAELLTSLTGKLNPAQYISQYSDIVALQVFDHQMHMMNLLTRVGWEARWGKAEQPATVKVRLENAAEELVDYLLFVDEAPLGGRIEGSSGFAEKFAAEGPFDSKGRSLRQLDLNRRLMRYPCSFMIYSEAFDALPAEAKGAVYQRLWAVLSGEVSGGKYARLSVGDRQAVLDILRETKKGLPGYFSPQPARAGGSVDWKLLQAGDVILSHSSLQDQAELFDPVYTHAALDLGVDESGEPLILEALSPELAEGLGEVRALPLKRTWLYRDAIRTDIYRRAGGLQPSQRDAIVKFGREIAAKHLPYRSTASFSDLYAAWLAWDPQKQRPRNEASFDAALKRLLEQKESTASFDCATLVWRAYREAGVDLSEPNRVELGGRLGNLSKEFLARIAPDFLTVDTLYRSGKLARVNP